MSSQADALSKKAAELAKRASQVHAAYIVAQREAHLGAEKSGASALVSSDSPKPKKAKKSKTDKKSKKLKAKKPKAKKPKAKKKSGK